VRNYCRRIRTELPETRILVLRPTLAEADLSKSTLRMKQAGADCVATSTKEASEAIANLLAGRERPRTEVRAVVA
jgi:hypothetical protein